MDKWDVSKGRKWVVVAFWGEETTVDFYGAEDEAVTAYQNAVDQGADAVCAKTSQMYLQETESD